MIYVIYHKTCNDGTSAALAAWLKFKKQAVYIPVQYGEPVPDMPDCKYLYIVDFSFPRNILEELNHLLKGNILVLDHHTSAEKDMVGLSYCKFDMKKCGAVMAWEFFNPGVEVPLFFKYIQDFDIHTHIMPNTKEVTAYINSYERSIEMYLILMNKFNVDFKDIVKEGTSIQRYHLMDLQKVCSSSRQYTWDGKYKCIIINAPAFMATDLGDMIFEKNNNIDFVCCYSDNKDGYRYYSFRSIGNFDVSAIAKSMHPLGGGHRNAAGVLIKNTVPLFIKETI